MKFEYAMEVERGGEEQTVAIIEKRGWGPQARGGKNSVLCNCVRSGARESAQSARLVYGPSNALWLYVHVLRHGARLESKCLHRDNAS